MKSRDVNYYLSLPHKIEFIPEEDGTGFTAVIPGLKGCTAFGETIEEAYQAVVEVKTAWLEIALERGWQIPEPTSEEIKGYSGKFVARLPRYLHRGLAELAEAQGTSLNQLVVALLAEGATRRRQGYRAIQPMAARWQFAPTYSESHLHYQIWQGVGSPGGRSEGVGEQWPKFFAKPGVQVARIQTGRRVEDINTCD